MSHTDPDETVQVPERAVCWGCGQLYDLDRMVRNGAGKDRPTCKSCRWQDKGQWMSCTGCQNVRRPRAPGQNTFTCNNCQRNRP